MSLHDAKRELQWTVVMEALANAEVDSETVKLVEFARSAGDMVNSMTSILLGGADAAKPKNYVKVELVGLTPPFERAYVELIRPGGKTSHELREMLRDRLVHVRGLLAEGTPSDGRREGVIEGIDLDLAAEAP